MKKISLFLSLFLSSSISSNQAQAFAPAAESTARLIVWDVGQGQWVTWYHRGICEHFDIGGEFAPWAQIRALCRSRPNRAHFSHWDWDHIGLATRAARELNDFCVEDFPAGPPPNRGKERLLNLKKCKAEVSDDATDETVDDSTIPLGHGRDLLSKHRHSSRSTHQLLWRHRRGRLTANDLSRVFDLENWAVVPGDSTQKEEKLWVPIETSRHPHVLVLGHHGSRTSTSEFLVSHLAKLNLAIASARKARYGHPHQEVVHRLKLHGVSMLRTEDWGSIQIGAPPD